MLSTYSMKKRGIFNIVRMLCNCVAGAESNAELNTVFNVFNSTEWK